jgi:hypothetical protein
MFSRNQCETSGVNANPTHSLAIAPGLSNFQSISRRVSAYGYRAATSLFAGTRLALTVVQTPLESKESSHMTRLTMSHTKQFLAVLGLSCICTTASLAQSAGQNGMQGSMTAYQFDGIYKGNSQQIAAHSETCGPGQEITVDVHDGRFKLAWHDPQVFDARIRPDGTFFATTASTVQAEKHMTIVPTLQGHIGTTGLVADYGTRWCRYRLEASQAPSGQHLSQRINEIGTHQ